MIVHVVTLAFMCTPVQCCVEFQFHTAYKVIISTLHLCLFLDPHDDNKMSADGVMRFLDDLGLDPASRLVLIIAWKFKAAQQCEFSKDEFITGMSDLG